jgi:hypothetical protein
MLEQKKDEKSIIDMNLPFQQLLSTSHIKYIHAHKLMPRFSLLGGIIVGQIF